MNPDQRLLRRTLDGDPGAFSELIRFHDDRMRALAFRLLGGDRDGMDDVLQEAYIRAFRGLATFRADADFATWLYRIVYNACIDELRKGQRRPEPVDVTAWDTAGAGAGPERTIAAADSVLRALAALPDDQRLTVVLVDGEGFDNAGAAELLGVAVGTVASRLSRARATMRRVLEADEEDGR